MHTKILTIVALIFSCCSAAHGQERIYSIGNSLTSDMLPGQLDDLPRFHIFCSRNLQFIFDNPLEHCVNSSLPWPTALTVLDFDWITVQPFSGTTLQQDVDIISYWMQMQPNAKFVIHPGWSHFISFADTFNEGNPDNNMRPSPEYISDLIAGLNELYPDRKIYSTRSNMLLYRIYEDIQQQSAPFIFFDQLYRDAIHMDNDLGRYLMHNALRFTIGQPLAKSGFDLTTEEMEYLDSIILDTSSNRYEFSPIRGNRTRGLVESIVDADDQYLEFQSGFTLSSTEPSVWVEFSKLGVRPTFELRMPKNQQLIFSIESGANTFGISQTIELFNFATETYEEYRTDQTQMSDSVVSVAVPRSNFVSPQDKSVRARVGWRKTGFTTVNPFTIRVDAIDWNFSGAE